MLESGRSIIVELMVDGGRWLLDIGVCASRPYRTAVLPAQTRHTGTGQTSLDHLRLDQEDFGQRDG